MTSETSPDLADIRERLGWFYETTDEIEFWLSAPQKLLGGAVANDLIAAGRADEVVRLLKQLDEGVFL